MIKKIIKCFHCISRVEFYYQRSIRDFNARRKISERIAKKIGKSEINGPSLLSRDSYSNTLNEKGYVDFGKVLNDFQIKSLKDQLNQYQCFDPFRPNHGRFLIDDVPSDVHVANYKREDLIAIPEILSLANDPKILNIAQEFLGATPTISNINCWWSMAGKERPEQAQSFHRDVDDYRFCKLFVYLTNVKMEEGPHVYVEGSQASNTLTKIRRYSDSEIESEFGKENVKYFIAPRGSMFMVNTYGFHKGFLPKNNNRLLLQVQYSLNPIGIESYSPQDIGSHSYNKKVNKLILK